MKNRALIAWVLALALAGVNRPALAEEFEIPDLPTFDLNEILPAGPVREIIKTIGFLTNHRPYQGATPLGPSGVDFGVEATLMHLPSGFGPALEEAGMGGGSSLANGALPMAKVHLHKGMGRATDLGFSGLYYPGNLIWGVDFKVVLAQPEEGLTWALRISYSDTSLDLSRFGLQGLPIQVGGVDVGQGNLKLSSRTWTPQLLASKRLEFAEPYFGIGLSHSAGQIEIPIKLTVLEEEQVLTTTPTSALEFQAFTGVSFRVQELGLRLALEGSYGHLGMHTLGLMFGFSL